MDATAVQHLIDVHLKAWTERDASLRIKLLEEAYTADALLNDPMQITVGLPAISNVIANLHKTTQGFVFQLDGQHDFQNDAIRFSWTYGPASNPRALTGQDFILLRNGKIAAVYAFINAPVK